MNDCIFCKIRDREIEKEFTYEDEDIMVFPDIHPLKPFHMLIIPKKHTVDFGALEDDQVLIKVKNTIQKLIKENNLNGEGYRIANNGGGAQAIDHLHFHLMAPINNAE